MIYQWGNGNVLKHSDRKVRKGQVKFDPDEAEDDNVEMEDKQEAEFQLSSGDDREDDGEDDEEEGEGNKKR